MRLVQSHTVPSRRPSIVAATALIAGAILLPAWAAPARAATPPAPAPAATNTVEPSAEALKAAQELTSLLGVQNQARTLMATFRAQMIGATMRAGAKDQADAVAIVDQELMPAFIGQESELEALLVRPYATNFAVSDLRDLIKFYRSPLGQRLINAMPAVNREGLRAGQALGAKIFKETIEKNKDKLHARGLKF